jgi:hypothetical protein
MQSPRSKHRVHSMRHKWQARHGILDAQYQAEFDSMVQRGFRLADVSGYGLGSSRYRNYLN